MAFGYFFCIPAYGHFNPTVPYVSELVSHGEDIAYFSTTPFKGRIESTGAVFRSLDHVMRPDLTGISTNMFELSNWVIEDTEAILDEVHPMARDEKPDFIIHDMTCLWARILAEVLAVPAISIIPSFAFGPRMILTSPDLFGSLLSTLGPAIPTVWRSFKSCRRLKRRFGVRVPPGPRALYNYEDMNIVWTTREFQPGARFFGEHFHFVGPSIGRRKEIEGFPFDQLSDRPLVLVSLGTLYHDQPWFYRETLRALGRLDVQAVIATGKRLDPEAIGSIPDNCLLFDSVPQLALLERADVFITHGGMNSVSEALCSGVPMLVTPQMVEQRYVARQAYRKGAAIVLEKEDVTADRLQAGVEELLNTPDYRESAVRQGQSLSAGGGYTRAAEITLDYLKTRGACGE